VSSVELLTLYISLELSSYSLLHPGAAAALGAGMQVEAGIKYVLFGAAASGVSLFA